jgi:DNA-directed RNA polymerase II subunit RPB11
MSRLVYENDIKDENWLTLPGETKIVEQPDAHWNSASMFTLHKEDHTVANLLRMKLHANSTVRFAAYKTPHPTLHIVEMTVQTAPVIDTTGNTSGGVAAASAAQPAVPTPAAAMQLAVDACIADVDEFTRLWHTRVMAHVVKRDLPVQQH